MAAAIFNGNFVKLLKNALRLGSRTSDPSGAATGDIYYNSSTSQLRTYNGTAWDVLAGGRVLQLLQTAKTDTFSSSSTTFTDITGLTVSITPSSTSSKILVIAQTSATHSSTGDAVILSLVRDTTEVFRGDAASTRPQATSFFIPGNLFNIFPAPTLYLDSPATTSSVTYKVQARVKTGTFYINRTVNDPDNADGARVASSIIVMEFL